MKPERWPSILRVVLALALGLGGYPLHPLTAGTGPSSVIPKNIIIFLGDGMGEDHVKAGGLFVYGVAGSMVFESFPQTTKMTTYSANDPVTESAASGTAIATGRKVNNAAISWNGTELKTILEYYKERGKSTGLVTTSEITDASPAAFGAHDYSRYNRDAIWEDFMRDSQPNVLLGAYKDFTDEWNASAVRTSAVTKGYTVVRNLGQLNAYKVGSQSNLSGQFAMGTNMEYMDWEYNHPTRGDADAPSLTDMTRVALDKLSQNPNGFFLFVENELIDEASHIGSQNRLCYELKAFNSAVQWAYEWARLRDDTLIIVLADHETGGLTVKGTGWTKGVVNRNDMAYTTSEHTSKKVPVYAWGVGAERTSLVSDNTDIIKLAFPQVAPMGPSHSHSSGRKTEWILLGPTLAHTRPRHCLCLATTSLNIGVLSQTQRE